MKMKSLLIVLAVILTPLLCRAGEVAIGVTDISRYYNKELPSQMDQLVTQEVQSEVFREMLVKSLQLKEDLNLQLLFELKITSEDDAGTMALSASISDLPTTTTDRILDVVDKYVRCRARGHSITCAQLVAMPVTPTDETKVSETVRKIVQEYPLVAPSLLLIDSVYKRETYSIETYVLKDELFAWYYEVDRSADGLITGIRESRVAQ